MNITTDNKIQGSPGLLERVHEWTKRPLGRFEGRFSRVEVHLSTENAEEKNGTVTTRCAIEGRLRHRDPTVAVHHAATVETAVRGAARKLQRALESELGRLERKPSST